MFALLVLVVWLPEQRLQPYHLCVSQPSVPRRLPSGDLLAWRWQTSS